MNKPKEVATEIEQSISMDVPWAVSSASTADLYPISLDTEYWERRDQRKCIYPVLNIVGWLYKCCCRFSCSVVLSISRRPDHFALYFRERGMMLWRAAVVILLGLIFQLQSNAGCDLFQGNWVMSETSSFSDLYDSSSCLFIQNEFNCLKNGRSDDLYLKYNWQPHSCNLSRFDGGEMLRRLKGKSIMFVGDSLSRNQWQSLLCMLYTAVPGTKYSETSNGEISTFTFTEFGVNVMLDHTVYLVDVVRESEGRILKLDFIEGGKRWKGIDMLIFNTWHWWNRRGATQPWDYIEVGGQLYKDMDRVVAFEKALNTWANWVDTNIDPTKTKVFFQGISPSHYNGSTWNEPSAKTCLGQKEPLVGSTYPGGLPPALAVLKRVLSTMKKPVELLDITNLSLLRKDGHPSIYGLAQTMDCSHWCLPGVPDTWNQILYTLLI